MMVTFGLVFSMVINSGGMENCLFGVGETMCPMGLVEHLSLWQTMIAVNLVKLITVLGFLLFVFYLAIFEDAIKEDFGYRKYAQQKPDIPLFDFLKQLFSQGILKPKLGSFLL